MERGTAKMTARGYVVQEQSGEFGRKLFAPVWKRKKVVVTFRLNTAWRSGSVDESPSPQRA
jgi:hypothetical protein